MNEIKTGNAVGLKNQGINDSINFKSSVNAITDKINAEVSKDLGKTFDGIVQTNFVQGDFKNTGLSSLACIVTDMNKLQYISNETIASRFHMEKVGVLSN